MYSKLSRYRSQPAVIAVDASGRAVRSTRLRLLPSVEGVVQHSVEELDRLDHLAFRYYRQSRHWWHVCDAHPDVLAPQALLGKEPWRPLNIPVVWEGLAPPWSALVRAIEGLKGVANVRIGTEDASQPVVTLVDGDAVATLTDTSVLDTLELVETALRTATPAAWPAPVDVTDQLRQALVDAGLPLTSPVRLDAVEPVRHRLRDADRRLYAIRYVEAESLAHVFAPTPHHEWMLSVTHNVHDPTPHELLNAVAGFALDGRSFTVGTPRPIGQVGKPIAIPAQPVLTSSVS